GPKRSTFSTSPRNHSESGAALRASGCAARACFVLLARRSVQYPLLSERFFADCVRANGHDSGMSWVIGLRRYGCSQEERTSMGLLDEVAKLAGMSGGTGGATTG